MSTSDSDDIKPDLLGPKPRQGSLLLQYALIGSGRVPNAPQEMRQAAAGVLEEVLDAARNAGSMAAAFPGSTHSFSVAAVYSIFDWLDAVCSAAGFEVVEEIFHRPKPQHLQ